MSRLLASRLPTSRAATSSAVPSRITTPARRDQGSAAIEFVAIGVLLLTPLIYIVIALSRIQAASFAADSSAREAARAFVTAVDDDDGRRRAAIAVRLGLRDQGFTGRWSRCGWRYPASPVSWTGCSRPGSRSAPGR